LNFDSITSDILITLRNCATIGENMGIELLALDVNGTRAEPSKPVKKEIAEKLQNFGRLGF
jgi:hypothetical protein